MYAFIIFTINTAEASSKWNKFAVTMPVSRRRIVAGKYIIYAVLVVMGVIIGLIHCAILHLIRRDFTFQILAVNGMAGLILSFFPGCVSLPFACVLDSEKLQIVFVSSSIGATGILAGAFFSFRNDNARVSALGIILALSIAAFVISFKAATKIYAQKDIV
jgi:ABC-type Na+ efflux pump permease subunit